MTVTSYYVHDACEVDLKPGMTFQCGGETPGTCTVLGPRAVGGLWDVQRPDGSIQPMRPSTILGAKGGVS